MGPFIGSEVWLQPWHSKECIIEQFIQMGKSGMSCARIFLDWRHVEPQRGIFDFVLYDHVIEAAERTGIKLQITLMHLNWLPRWRQKEIIKQGNFSDPEPDNNRLREIYIKKVVQRYAKSEALDAWILANEPRINIPRTEINLKRFRKFVAEYHMDTQELYKLYGTTDVEEIGVVKPDGSIELGLDLQWEFAGEIDWARMESDTLMSLLQRTKDIIREFDKIHPTTLNPDDVSKASPIQGGRDLWRFGRIADFLGVSCHIAWHSTRFSEDNVHQSVGMFCDMVRSATRAEENYFQVTELQAGTNYFSGIRPTCPSPEDLQLWILELIGGGARGIIYWLLNSREHGFEGLEWGLNNQEGKESRRTKASFEMTKLLQSIAAFSDAKPLPPEIYLLHDLDSIDLAVLETQIANADEDKKMARNTYMISDALCGAYCLLWDLGYRVGFVNGNNIDSIPEDAWLIAPNVYAPREETTKKIEAFVEGGGHLIVDGLFAVKDSYGNRPSRNEFMKKLFGGILEDFEVSGKKMYMISDEKQVPAYYLKGSFEEKPQRKILARWQDGMASVIQTGNCTYIGTQFFQKYFSDEGNRELREFLKSVLPKHRGVALKNPDTQLHLRAMDNVLILTNHGKQTTAELLIPENGMIYKMLDGRRITNSVQIEEKGYVILLADLETDRNKRENQEN